MRSTRRTPGETTGPADMALSVAPVAAWIVLVAITLWWPTGFNYVVAEDHAFEWIQVSAFAVAAGGFLVLAVLMRRRDLVVTVTAAIGFALFVVVVGEELAWGQRLFGVSVPAIERVNQQGDVSLHNIGAGLKLSQLGLLGVALAGLLSRPAGRWLSKHRSLSSLSDFLPPPFLMTWFALPAAYTGIRLLFIPSPSHRVAKFSEIAELTVALASAITAIHLARTASRSHTSDQPTSGRTRPPLTPRTS